MNSNNSFSIQSLEESSKTVKEDRNDDALTILLERQPSFMRDMLLYTNHAPTEANIGKKYLSFESVGIVPRMKLALRNFLVYLDVANSLHHTLLSNPTRCFSKKGDQSRRIYQESDPDYIKAKGEAEARSEENPFVLISVNEINHLKSTLRHEAVEVFPDLITKIFVELIGNRTNFTYLTTRVKLYQCQREPVAYFARKLKEARAEIQQHVEELHDISVRQNWLHYKEKNKNGGENYGEYTKRLIKDTVSLVLKESKKYQAGKPSLITQQVAAALESLGIRCGDVDPSATDGKVSWSDGVGMSKAITGYYRKSCLSGNMNDRAQAILYIYDLAKKCGVNGSTVAGIYLDNNFKVPQSFYSDMDRQFDEVARSGITTDFFMDQGFHVMGYKQRTRKYNTRRFIDLEFELFLDKILPEKLVSMSNHKDRVEHSDAAIILSDEAYISLSSSRTRGVADAMENFAELHLPADPKDVSGDDVDVQSAGFAVIKSQKKRSAKETTIVNKPSTGIINTFTMAYRAGVKVKNDKDLAVEIPINEQTAVFAQATDSAGYISDLHFQLKAADIQKMVEKKDRELEAFTQSLNAKSSSTDFFRAPMNTSSLGGQSPPLSASSPVPQQVPQQQSRAADLFGSASNSPQASSSRAAGLFGQQASSSPAAAAEAAEQISNEADELSKSLRQQNSQQQSGGYSPQSRNSPLSQPQSPGRIPANVPASVTGVANGF